MNAGATLGVDVRQDEDACFICFETSPSPIQSGCTCRGGAGLAHPGCRIRAVQALVQQKGSVAWWWKCQTCEQHFTGEMRDGLANPWWSQVRDPAAEPEASDLKGRIKYLLRKLIQNADLQTLTSRMCKEHVREQLGAEGEAVLSAHRQVIKDTIDQTLRLKLPDGDRLYAAANLACCLSDQGKSAEAEEMEYEGHTLLKCGGGGAAGEGRGAAGGCELSRELLKAADMLACAGNLAHTLLDQGKHAEAEEMQREVLAVQKRENIQTN